jgi:hypothetical protein
VDEETAGASERAAGRSAIKMLTTSRQVEDRPF